MNSNTTPRVARRITSPAVAPPGIPLPTDDAPIPAHRYYTPPPRPLASCERQRSGEAPALALTTDTRFHNIVTMTSGHGGVGLSVMASMLAWTLARREHSCALIDADFVAGCLDLLLGVEREPGLRFSQVDAPLGRIEGDAMNHELMMWEGVRVLPYDPWSARQPDWWEVQAAIRALAETNDVVIVDAGQGGLIETVPDLRSGMQVIAAELSVMGLARAKSHRSRLDSWGCEAPHIVGVEPRGAPRGGGPGLFDCHGIGACQTKCQSVWRRTGRPRHQIGDQRQPQSRELACRSCRAGHSPGFGSFLQGPVMRYGCRNHSG